MTLWKVLSQLPQGLRGLLQIFLTQRDPMRRLTPVSPLSWASHLRGPSQLASTSMTQGPMEGSSSDAPSARALGTQGSLLPGPYLSGPGVHPQLLGQNQEGRQLLVV